MPPLQRRNNNTEPTPTDTTASEAPRRWEGFEMEWQQNIATATDSASGLARSRSNLISDMLARMDRVNESPDSSTGESAEDILNNMEQVLADDTEDEEEEDAIDPGDSIDGLSFDSVGFNPPLESRGGHMGQHDRGVLNNPRDESGKTEKDFVLNITEENESDTKQDKVSKGDDREKL